MAENEELPDVQFRVLMFANTVGTDFTVDNALQSMRWEDTDAVRAGAESLVGRGFLRGDEEVNFHITKEGSDYLLTVNTDRI